MKSRNSATDKIILIGCGGHAKSVVDSLEADGKYEIVGFAAEEYSDFSYRGYKIVCVDEELPDLFQEGVKNAFICIGFMGKGNVRKKIYDKIKDIGYEVPAIIDSTAVIAQDAYIEEGTYVGKKAVVNANATVGKMVIINTAAIVEHDCAVGDFTHIAVNAVICGGVKVGRECLIGANAAILQERNVGDYSVIGMGAVVTKNIPVGVVAVGMPAKVIRR